MPSLFAIVASQRSGTQLLREVLNSNSRVAIAAEPFTPVDQYPTWHNYLRSLAPQDAVPSTTADAMRLLDEFGEYVQRDTSANPSLYGGAKQSPTWIGFDVKYNQLRYPSPVYTDLQARPFLLDYFRDRNVRIIHLVRGNVLQVAISIIIANQRQVWHNCDGSTLPGAYRIPVDELFAYAQWAQSERVEFERLSQDLTVERVDYDDVVDDLRDASAGSSLCASSKAFGRIANLLEVPNQFSYNGYIRKVINRPYADVVENYDEVVDAVNRSQLAEFAGSI